MGTALSWFKGVYDLRYVDTTFISLYRPIAYSLFHSKQCIQLPNFMLKKVFENHQ
jgi:hypothetical protein